MTTLTSTARIENASTRNESSASSARVTLDPFSNLGLPVQQLERTYGAPRNVGDGARRAVREFGAALEKLSE